MGLPPTATSVLTSARPPPAIFARPQTHGILDSSSTFASHTLLFYYAFQSAVHPPLAHSDYAPDIYTGH
ncbi:hypothetical protein, partial [Thermus scotoductus]|uniref:hypothetical protein n=1 Tax=Thermus scotoductus TaxID=37636 RepID=UPI001C12B9D5